MVDSHKNNPTNSEFMTQSDFVTPWGRISYFARGGSPTYMFIHGLGGDKTLFDEAFRHERGMRFGIISVDLLGFGSSSRLDDGHSYTFSLQAEALRELLTQLNVSECNLVLHSMASGLLPALTEFADLRIPSIFLLEGNLVYEDAGWSRSISEMPEGEFGTYFNRVKKTARYVMRQQLKGPHPKEQIERWSKCYQNANARAMREMALETYAATQQGKIANALKGVTARVVYLKGLDENSWSGHDFLIENGFELVKLPDAGHYLMLDDPETVYGTIFGN